MSDEPQAVRALPVPAAMRRVTRDVLATLEWRIPSWLAYWGAVGLCLFGWSIAALVWAYQIYTGLHITGLRHPVMWGAYITSFVFWIGIAHSGTLISAILFLLRALADDARARRRDDDDRRGDDGGDFSDPASRPRLAVLLA